MGNGDTSGGGNVELRSPMWRDNRMDGAQPSVVEGTRPMCARCRERLDARGYCPCDDEWWSAYGNGEGE